MRILKNTKKYRGLWVSVRFVRISKDIWNIDLIINKSKRTICDWQNLRKNKRTKKVNTKKTCGSYSHLHEAKKMFLCLNKQVPADGHLYITAENNRVPVLIKRALEKLGFTSYPQPDESAAWVLTAHQREGELQNWMYTK